MAVRRRSAVTTAARDAVATTAEATVFLDPSGRRWRTLVLLSAPVDVLLARVARRDNPFGSTAEDRTKIASDLAAFEPVLRTGADHEIVTTAPIPVVVSKVEKLAAAVR